MGPDGARPRRRGRTSGLVAVAVVLAVLVAAAGDAWVLTRRVPSVAVADTRQGDGTAYLLVGSDSRERLVGEDASDYRDAEQAVGERADVVMVLLDPAQGRSRLLLIPRDLWVQPPGRDGYRLGLSLDDGPATLVDNLCRDLGVGLDHTVIIDFRGLIDVVDAMGGIEISPELPTRDAKARLLLERSGSQRVDGRAALAWVRSRDAEVRRDGVWVDAPRDPSVRTRHALDVVRAVADSIEDPLTLQRVAWSGGPHARRDDRLGPVGFARMGSSLRAALAADRVSTVPVRLSRTQVPVGFPTEGTTEALAPFRSTGCGTDVAR